MEAWWCERKRQNEEMERERERERERMVEGGDTPPLNIIFNFV